MEDFFVLNYEPSEDEHKLEYAFFGIFDGHGGKEAALFAKEHLMNFIVSDKRFWSDNDDDVLQAITSGYLQTHYAMWQDQGKEQRGLYFEMQVRIPKVLTDIFCSHVDLSSGFWLL